MLQAEVQIAFRDPRRPRTRRQSALSLPGSPALQPPVAACRAAAAPNPAPASAPTYTRGIRGSDSVGAG